MIYDYASRGSQSTQLSKDYEIGYKSAWFAHLRIMELLRLDLDQLDFSEDGVYEIDGVGIVDIPLKLSM